jgi:putative membrane protein
VPPTDDAPAKPPAGNPPTYDVRHYLAEERTFLAWIRTILGLMAFGVLVARMDRFFLAFGTAFIVIGAALSFLSIQRHRRIVEELNHQQSTADHPSRLGISLALLLTVSGIAMALYLIW